LPVRWRRRCWITGCRTATSRGRLAIIELRPGSAPYRINGDFTHAGKQAAAPLVQMTVPKPLAIMKHQVSSADYQRCVDDGACRAFDLGVSVGADRPAVQTSWYDANGYAAWLSHKTGEIYRLPTDEEWAFAAGSKFKDDGIAIDDNDPSKRWIARYEREADRAPSTPGNPHVRILRIERKPTAATSGSGQPPASSVTFLTMPARLYLKTRTAAFSSRKWRAISPLRS
jgi:hypothetical protein